MLILSGPVLLQIVDFSGGVACLILFQLDYFDRLSSTRTSWSSSESSCGNNNNTTNACGDGICEAIVEEEDEEGYVERPMFSMDL